MIIKKGTVFIFCFFIILIYPLYGSVFDTFNELGGAYRKDEKPIVSFDAIMDGSYQNEMESYISENIPGRTFLIKIRNQILYSVFNTSPNVNVVLGKDKSLFEQSYINWQTQIYQMSDEEIDNKIQKLTELQNLLESHNKKLYLFLTPSKARVCKDEIPLIWKNVKNYEDKDGLYERFVNALSDTSLNYFDSIEYLNGQEEDVPFFYNTGIHWSRVWGARTAAAFMDYLSEKEGIDLPTIHVEVEKVDKPVEPDADLYTSCNVFLEPSGTYYKDILTPISGGNQLNAFIRTSSFGGQSLFLLSQNQVFNKYTYLENNYYMTETHGMKPISTFSSYNEIEDLVSLLQESDVVLLEINESHINRMSFEFIEYLLDNPDYVQTK